MYIISKEFKFDAAHRIHKHFGKCANLHGHTYKVVLFLKSNTLDNFNVVHDYYHFKTFKEFIDDNFDHATIVAETDSDLLIATKIMGKRIIIKASTAEYLAEYFYYKAIDFFSKDLVLKVLVRETENTGAEFYE